MSFKRCITATDQGITLADYSYAMEGILSRHQKDGLIQKDDRI